VKTHSRLIAMPIAVTALLAGTLAVAAPAQAADVTVTDMATLKLAAASCTDGSTITLGADIETVIVPPSFYSTDEVNTGCSMTLDLNDHRLSLARVLVGEDTTLRIRGGSGGSGELVATAGDYRRSTIDTTDAALVIDSGVITATVGSYAAAIGSSYGGNPGSITINGGTVTADSNEGSAAIGGAYTGQGGTVTINGGTVTATGRGGGSGIGSGEFGGHGAISINGGTVVATGEGGAGLGDGSAPEPGERGPIRINGGTVVATGGTLSPGIGGAGQAVSIGTGADVTVVGGRTYDATATVSSVGGDSIAGRPFGSLEVAGTLRIPTEAHLTVPAGETASVTSTGLITGSTGQADGGTIYGPGTVANAGSIRLPDSQVVDSTTPARVTDHHYAVSFDTQGGSAAPAPVTVLARSFADGGRTFPGAPSKPGASFSGWNSKADGSGVPIDAASTLPGSATSGPRAVTAYAQYVAPPPQAGPSPTISGLAPSVTGVPRERKILSARPGTVTPAGTTFTYQWLSDRKPVRGATAQTFRLGRKQAGHRVSVRITATSTGTPAVNRTSSQTRRISSPYKRIVLADRSIRDGQTFRVVATGFAPGQKIRVWLAGIAATTMRADSTGTVNRPVRFPDRTKVGVRRVRVSGYTAKGQRTGTVHTLVRYRH
jgi:hypothetical protein